MRATHGLWAGGATVGVASVAFGFLRADDGTVPFFALLAVAAAGYLATLHLIANGLRPSGRALIGCAAMALAFRIPLLLLPPEPGADLRRYLWDAHLVRNGLSPYAVIPADPAFAYLRTAENWPVNNPEVESPYPPGAQLFFLAATAASESARAVKIALLVCDALLALLVWRSIVAARANPGWLLAYLWSPLVLLEVSRHGHLDVAGALCIACAAFALARGRALLGSIAFALAIAVKPLPIVLVPLLWRRVSRWHAAAAVAALVAIYLPFWEGKKLPLGSVPEVIDRFRFNAPIFTAVASVAGPATAAGFALAAGLAVAAWARRRLPLSSPQAWAWPMASALLCAPLVYPWYLVWLAPFLAGPGTMPLTTWTVSILGTYIVWQLAPWVVPGWALFLEYGALVGALFWVWRRRRLAGEVNTSPLSVP